MRIPKPKSAPGIFLYSLTAVSTLLLGRIVWVIIGQNVETVSAERGYDKLLSRHWTEIMAWLAANGFWLSITTAAFVGATLALWAYIVLQSNASMTEQSGSQQIERAWYEGRTRFTIREAACRVAGSNPLDFEKSSEAQTEAHEMLFYVRRALIRPAEMSERQISMLREGRSDHGFDLEGVTLDTYISVEELETYLRPGWKSWLPVLDEQSRDRH